MRTACILWRHFLNYLLVWENTSTSGLALGHSWARLFPEGIRKKAEKTSKQHSSIFSAFGSWLVPSITIEAS